MRCRADRYVVARAGAKARNNASKGELVTRNVTINGGCEGKKTPKIAPTGVRVAERRTIGS